MTTIEIKTDIAKWDKMIASVEKNFGKYAVIEGQMLFFPYIKNQIVKLIEMGGSPKHEYSFGWWERVGKEFVYKKGKSNFFTSKWSGKQGTRYPIHPRWLAKRKIRKSTVDTALWDTSNMMYSFIISREHYENTKGEFEIRSTDKNLDKHEYGRGVPPRPVIKPVGEIFNLNKDLHERWTVQLFRALEREIY